MKEVRLAEESFLTDHFLGQLISVGEVDILVGVPTHNNANTIRSIVETIQAGILTFFPGKELPSLTQTEVRGMARLNWSCVRRSVMRSLAPSRMPSVHCLRSARSMRAALPTGLHYGLYWRLPNCCAPKPAR